MKFYLHFQIIDREMTLRTTASTLFLWYRNRDKYIRISRECVFIQCLNHQEHPISIIGLLVSPYKNFPQEHKIPGDYITKFSSFLAITISDLSLTVGRQRLIKLFHTRMQLTWHNICWIKKCAIHRLNIAIDEINLRTSHPSENSLRCY